MAGKGPRPKDPKTRARTNKATTRAEVEAPPEAVAMPDPAQPPALPTQDAPWHPRTLAWWAAVWSPIANPFCVKYLKVDEFGLERLAMLVDTYYATRDLDCLKEIRLQEPRWGLDQMARRSLQWQVKEPKAPKPAPPASQQKVAVGDDPRRVLQMVPKK